ncbi:hypothetical protein WAI453_004533 [Rhynchosporium graminicola]|uniref:Uncharacterized protein n=1 Tax=Rhynchosporium graminicola TaxID=2792576 RepID=A0A1E1LLN9_9HELO|nr:uncharacterized protein RCO7_03766 [Rhynchosporium commune]
MATTIPLRSLKFSFFQMEMQKTIYGSGNEVPPTRKIPIANKDLVFVHLNEITGPTQDISARHKVRVHVMRDFQRKKHKESKPTKTNKRSSLPNHDVSFKNLANDDIGVASSEKSAREQAILPDEIRRMTHLPDPTVIGMLEPFNILPITGSPRLQLLVHHYNTYLINTLIPVNPKDKWFNFAIIDAALFHGTMMPAAMHHRLVNGGSDQGEQAQLKRDTIMLVNQRLEDPVLSRSDFTIGAVTCLVLLEASQVPNLARSKTDLDGWNQEGNMALSNIHLSGLKIMVDLRGGIYELGLAGVLRRKILWYVCVTDPQQID